MAEFRPGGFKILPPVVKNIIIICALVFLAQQVSLRVFHYPLAYLFALHYWQSPLFKPYQLVTSIFMHAGFWHIALNMFALWMFGYTVENVWGSKRFLTFYMVCGIGAAVCFLGAQTFQFHHLTQEYTNGRLPIQVIEQFLAEPMLGASGAIFGVLVAFGVMFPNSYIYLYFLVPIKTKWFVLGYIALELYSGIKDNVSPVPGDNVAHFAHLGGALVGFILAKYWINKGIGRGSY
ncbi:MAG: rhomboid family intramembrane serine protease [Chitinophagaceae bacterium]|nr:MAG: rhomboid family intramembrane serine protease [Chitinophagaceae bacterium]